MGTYTKLWRTPGVARIVSSQLMARFPFGMMSLGFVIHIQQVHNSYAIAGIALGAETIGAAISGPVLGRNLGVFGVRRLIAVTSVISASAVAVIGLTQAPPLIMILLALVVGLTSPPIQSAARTIYPTLVAKKQMNAMFGLDATLQELIWVIGPVLATVLAAQFSSSFAVTTMAVLQLIGSGWFLLNKEVGTIQIPSSTSKMGGVLKNKIVLANVILGLLLVGSFAGVEVGTVGLLDKGTAGLVIASLSLGSLLGGLLLGNRAKSRWALTQFSILILFGYSLAFIFPTSALWLAICWFIAGIGIAPALGALGAIISVSLKMSETAEAFGWVNTGQLIGYSAAAALAGIAIDTISPIASFMIAAIFGVATVAVAAMTASITPALAKSHPATEPIKIAKTKK